MINLRVAAASTFTFGLLLLAWGKLAEKGYEKVMPKLEEQKQRSAEQQQEFSRLIREDMAGLGADPADMENPPGPGQLSTTMPARQLRPLGTWMGVRAGDDRNLVFMKFDKKHYWIWIKKPGGADIKEKGNYEYLFDSIEFKPEGKPSYILEYYMVSKNGISLSDYNNYYKLEREEDIEFDF